MPNTDEERILSRDLAHKIYLNHLKTGGDGWDINHVATEISYEETTRRGLLGECVFSRDFSVPMNTEILDYGDSGRDFMLPLVTPCGVRGFKVNVKAKSVQVSWEALRRSGTHLRVGVKECRPETIYVFAIYNEPTDDADILRWDWGYKLIQRNERACFKNSKGGYAFIKPYEELRDLDELKDRMVIWRRTAGGEQSELFTLFRPHVTFFDHDCAGIS
jgi:hypothetical protein